MKRINVLHGTTRTGFLATAASLLAACGVIRAATAGGGC